VKSLIANGFPDECGYEASRPLPAAEVFQTSSMMDSETPLGHRIVKQLHGIAARLTGDLDLQKDLMQEMCIHLVQVEANRPGQTVSWYLQGCHFRARSYLDRGRSIDSIKRGNNLVLMDRGDNDGNSDLNVCPDACDPNDLLSELIARDIVDLLVPQLTDTERQILFLLMEGFGVCEIARELCVSHPVVIKHRRRIAHTTSVLLADSAGIGSRGASDGHSVFSQTGCDKSVGIRFPRSCIK